METVISQEYTGYFHWRQQVKQCETESVSLAMLEWLENIRM